MDKDTNLQRIIEDTVCMLHTDIHLCDNISPELHVYHPFVCSSIQFINGRYVDIIKDEAGYREYMKLMEQMIRKAPDIEYVFSMVNGPYKLCWYKFNCTSMGEMDRAKYLQKAWVTEENPNMDCNMTINAVIREFRKCKKEYLMTETEMKVYNDFPDTFRIYRGVSIGRNPKGISYTANIQTATWFAHRFDTEEKQGYILTGMAEKKNVLAYLNSRGEDEIVYDVRKFKTEKLKEGDIL